MSYHKGVGYQMEGMKGEGLHALGKIISQQVGGTFVGNGCCSKGSGVSSKVVAKLKKMNQEVGIRSLGLAPAKLKQMKARMAKMKRHGSGMYGKGMYGSGFFQDAWDFLRGRKKIKPKQILKIFGQVASTGADILGDDSKIGKHLGTASKYAKKGEKLAERFEGSGKNALRKAIHGHINQILGMRQKYFTNPSKLGAKKMHVSELRLNPTKLNRLKEHMAAKSGRGKGSGLWDTLKKFIHGETKLTPTAILKAFSKLSGIGADIASMAGKQDIATGLRVAGRVSKAGQKITKKLSTTGRGISGSGGYTGPVCSCRSSTKKGKGLNLAGHQYGKGLALAGRGRRKKKGSRSEVWSGLAEKTAGGLVKSDLILSGGRYKSKKKVAAGKRCYAMHGAGLKQHQFKKKY